MKVLNTDKNGENISTRVYKDDYGKYSIAISKKVGEEYVNRYFPVEFLKGVELDSGTDIIIKHAFITWFDWEHEDKKGTKFVIKITTFDKVNAEEPVLRPSPKVEDKIGSAQSIELEPDDLPFY